MKLLRFIWIVLRIHKFNIFSKFNIQDTAPLLRKVGEGPHHYVIVGSADSISQQHLQKYLDDVIEGKYRDKFIYLINKANAIRNGHHSVPRPLPVAHDDVELMNRVFWKTFWGCSSPSLLEAVDLTGQPTEESSVDLTDEPPDPIAPETISSKPKRKYNKRKKKGK